MLPMAFFAAEGHAVKRLRILKNTLGVILGTDFCDLLIFSPGRGNKYLISQGCTLTFQAGFGLNSLIYCPISGDKIIM